MKKLLNIKAIAIVIAILVVIIGVAINFTTNTEESEYNPKEFCVVKAKDIITELKKNSRHNADYSKYTIEELDKTITENEQKYEKGHDNYYVPIAIGDLTPAQQRRLDRQVEQAYQSFLLVYKDYKETVLALQKEIKKRMEDEKLADYKPLYENILDNIARYTNRIECDE